MEPLKRGKQDFERNISGKGEAREFQEKCVIKFHCFSKTTKTRFSQAPSTKAEAEHKSVFSNATIPKGNTLSLASSMSMFSIGLSYSQRKGKKKTI